MNSYDMAYAIMAYYRYTRGFICASECMNADILVYTNKNEWHEIEIKTSKSDMWRGEARKPKHRLMRDDPDNKYYGLVPHKFYMAVPTGLVEEAKKWVVATNSKYGIIECKSCDLGRSNPVINSDIFIVKSAKRIHNRECNGKILKYVMKRVCSENINHMHRTIVQKNEIEARTLEIANKWKINVKCLDVQSKHIL